MARRQRRGERRTDPVRLSGHVRRSRRALMLSTALSATAIVVLAVPRAPARAQPAPTARPTGAQVVVGAASVAQTTAATTVTQPAGSPRTAINWQSFDVGSQHTVTFQQPSSTAIVLNRVVGPNPSEIAGRITANGQIAIVNQSGVVFYQGAQVNAAAVMVSSNNISNHNFAAGRMVFDRPGKPNARIENRGEITVKETGLAALVAPQVANSGKITAKLGTVVLASGTAQTVDLYGDKLLSIDVTGQVKQAPVGPDGKVVKALVTNTGTIAADGGNITLTAQAADGIVQNLVSAGGKLRANTVGDKAGTIRIAGLGGSITIEGDVGARGVAPGTKGGAVEMVATDAVKVTPRARVSASGDAGGGTIALGTTLARANGGAASSKAMTAGTVTVDAGATLRANARSTGNGGKVAALSTGTTTVRGDIAARGGKTSGDGGFVDVSSTGRIVLDAKVDTTAPAGKVGTLVLDPSDLVISDASPGALPSGDSWVSISTLNSSAAAVAENSAGSIFVAHSDGTANAISLSNSLTLNAGGGITVDRGMTITASTVSLNAGTDILLGGTSGATFGISTTVGTAAPAVIASTAGGIALNAGGAVSEPVANLVVTGSPATNVLSVTARGTASLASPGNQVDALGAVTVSNGDFNFVSNVPFNVIHAVSVTRSGAAVRLTYAPPAGASVPTTPAISIDGGSITAGALTAGGLRDGVVALNTQVLAGWGNVADVIEPNGSIAAGNLVGDVAGSLFLANPGNAIGHLGAPGTTQPALKAHGATLSVGDSVSVTVAGAVQGDQDVSLSTAGNLTLSNGASVSAGRDATLLATLAIANGGTISAMRDATVHSGAGLTSNGTITGGRNADVEGVALANAGSIAGTASATVRAGASLHNAGSISGGDVWLDAVNDILQLGTVSGSLVRESAGDAIFHSGHSEATNFLLLEARGTANPFDVQQAAGAGSILHSSGNLTIDAATGIAIGGLVSAPAGTVALAAQAGDIIETAVGGATATGAVEAAQLTGSASGRAMFDAVAGAAGYNAVAQLHPFATGSGFTLENGVPLTVSGAVSATASGATIRLAYTPQTVTPTPGPSFGAIEIATNGALIAGTKPGGAPTGTVPDGHVVLVTNRRSSSADADVGEPGGTIEAATLTAAVDGSLRLANPANLIGALGQSGATPAGVTVAGAAFDLADGAPIIVRQAVAAPNGRVRLGYQRNAAADPTGSFAAISIDGGSVTADQVSLATSYAMSTPGASATYYADITEPNGFIAAGLLTGSAQGSIHLGSPTNQIATLGPLAATGGGTMPAGGAISVADGTDLAVTAPVSATYDIAMSTPGILTVTTAGSVSATQHDATLAAGQHIWNNGVVTAGDDAILSATGNIGNTGSIDADHTASLTAGLAIENDKTVTGRTNAVFKAGASIRNVAGGTIDGGVIILDAAADVHQLGTVGTAATTAATEHAGGVLDHAGSTEATDSVHLQADGTSNAFGLQQGVGSVVTARAGDVYIGAATGIALGGVVSAAGTVQLTAASGDIQEAAVGGASGTGRVAASLLTGSATGALLLDGAANAVQAIGPFTTGGNLTLHDGVPALAVVGTVSAGGDATLVNTNDLTVAAGAQLLAGHDALTVVGGTIANDGTVTAAAGAQALAGGAIVNVGTFQGGTVTMTASNNAGAPDAIRVATGSSVIAGGDATLTSASGLAIGGTLRAGGTANLVAQAGDISETDLGATSPTGAVEATLLAGSAAGSVRLDTPVGAAAGNRVAQLGSFAANGDFTFYDQSALSVVGGVSTGAAHRLWLQTPSLALAGGSLAAPADVATAGVVHPGLVTLQADAMSLAGGTVSALDGTVALAPLTLGGTLGVDPATALGRLSLTQADLSAIAAGSGVGAPAGTQTLALGSLDGTAATITAGAVQVNAPVDLRPVVSTLSMFSTGDVTEAPAGGVAVNMLTGAAPSGSIRLDGGANAVAQIGVVPPVGLGNRGSAAPTGLTAQGDVVLYDQSNLAVATTVQAGSGATADLRAGNVGLAGAPSRSLSIAGSVGGGTVALYSTGDTNETGAIVAGLLTGQAGVIPAADGSGGVLGNASLVGANQVPVLGNYATTGNFTLNDQSALDVAGLAAAGLASTTTPGAVGAYTASVNVPGNALTISGQLNAGVAAAGMPPLPGGNVSLTAGSIAIPGGLVARPGGSGAGGTLAFEARASSATGASGAVTEGASGAIAASLLTGVADGPVSLFSGAPGAYRNAVQTIGDVTAGGALSLLDGVALAAHGTISAANVLVEAGGDLTQTGGSISGQTVRLISDGGSIAQAAGASLTATGAIGGIALTAQQNIDIAGALTALHWGGVDMAATSGSITQAGGSTIAATDPNGSVGLLAGQGIALGGSIASGNAVSMVAQAGSISETAAGAQGIVTTRALSASAGGSIALDNGGNRIATAQSLAARGGSLTLADTPDLAVQGPVTAATTATVNEAGVLTLAAGSSVGAPQVTLNARAIAIGGTVTGRAAGAGSVALSASGGDITETGLVDTDLLTVRTPGNAILYTANRVASLERVEAGTSFSLADSQALRIGGVLASPVIHIDLGANAVTLENGLEIRTAGVARPPGKLARGFSALPAYASFQPGLYVQAGNFMQLGVVSVVPGGGGSTTVRFDVTSPTGQIVFARGAGLSGPTTDLILDLGSGSATGQLAVGTLDVAYSSGAFGGAQLLGSVGGLAGQGAASRSFIYLQPNAKYRINACAIGSVNCFALSMLTVPVINPLQDIYLGVLGNPQDNVDLLLPDVSERDY